MSSIVQHVPVQEVAIGLWNDACIEAFYEPRRRHSALGYRGSAEFERRYDPGTSVA